MWGKNRCAGKRCCLRDPVSNADRPSGRTRPWVVAPWKSRYDSGRTSSTTKKDAVIRRRLAALALLPLIFLASNAQAASSDPLGDLFMSMVTGALPSLPGWNLKATLYHAGAKGVGALDSLGCKVVAMRTVAVDKNLIPKHSVLFIKETVGLKMPDGSLHDGYWYASDAGSAIKGQRIDLYTGANAHSMTGLRALNLASLTAIKVGEFKGCPPA
jgi:3D (Asp-Asp-Asp) domain-containing protein